jgi:hypothetical protein
MPTDVPVKFAGELCDRLDKALRSTEMNLSSVASLVVTVIRDELWRERVVRTGEVIKCESFLKLLTSPPLHGYGEDPKRIQSLLRDHPEAEKMFMEATTAKHGGDHTSEQGKQSKTNNISLAPTHGTARAYTLGRLSRKAPELYDRVVKKELSANAAAIQAGFRHKPTVLDKLLQIWGQATESEQQEFLRRIKKAAKT